MYSDLYRFVMALCDGDSTALAGLVTVGLELDLEIPASKPEMRLDS